MAELGPVEKVDNGDAIEAPTALTKFPDELWTMIFEKLGNSSQDLLNCTRVCKKWSRILKSDECSWLFDQVRINYCIFCSCS